MDEENIKFECGTILRTKQNTFTFLCLHCRVEFNSIFEFIEHDHGNDYSERWLLVEYEFKDVNDEIVLTTGEDINIDINNSTIDPNLNPICDSLTGKSVRKKSVQTTWLHTWTCDICLQTKNTNESLKESVNRHMKRHMKRFHNATCELKKHPKLHKCTECNKAFRIAQLRDDHMAVHLGKKPYQCQNCSYRSASKGSMYRHNRIHHYHYDVHKYICHICGLKFQTKQNLMSHNNSHLGLKPYSCDECGKEFANKNYVKVHKRYHMDLRPFKCHHCDESFVLNSHLLRHIRDHAGTLKNIACIHCEKKFDSQSKFKEHLNVHMLVRDFSCDICKKKFSRLRAMKYHLIKVHSESINK